MQYPTTDGISFVVPVFRSNESLAPLAGRIRAWAGSRGIAHELLFVDDNGDDTSHATLAAIAAADPAVRVLTLSRNYGQHNALLCGVRAARKPLVVTLDDDLQHPPEELDRMLAVFTDDVDLVYGYAEREPAGLWRNLASVATKRVVLAARGREGAPWISAFRLFRTHLREAFAGYDSPHVALDVLLAWATTRAVAVPVAHQPRAYGRSTYTTRRLVSLALTLLIGYSDRLLHLASLLGIAFAGFGFLLLAYVVGHYFLHNGASVPGFTFLASVISIFAGIQLLVLGLIGEYLARLHARSTGRPAYLLRAETPARD